MKHIAITLILLFAVISVGNTQEYTVNYESRTEIPDSLKQSVPEGLKDKISAILYIKDSLIKLSADVGLKNFLVEIIINSKIENAMMLMNSDSSRIAEMIDSNYQKQFINENLTVELLPETKTILGEQCSKAHYKGEYGTQTTVWYVPGYEPPISIMGYLEKQIPGVILQLVNEFNGMKIIIEATSFKREVESPEEVFDFTIPEGYELKE